jgi:hypothetical protein
MPPFVKYDIQEAFRTYKPDAEGFYLVALMVNQ